MRHLPSRLPVLVVPTVLLLGLAASALPAQGVEMTLESSRTEVSTCPGDSFQVIVRLSNPSLEEIGGYQVFLRFSARHFIPVRYEANAVSSFVELGGPFPFGSGYRACAVPIADGWGDGAGEDVVSVAATAFAAGSDEAFRDASAELGRFVFRPRGEPAGPEGVSFASNLEMCHLPIDQTSKVFGADGRTLASGIASTFSVRVTEGGASVRDLSCIDGIDRVILRWFSPPPSEFGGLRIYRNGEVIAQLNVNFLTQYEDSSPLSGPATYEVALILRTGTEGCRASCSLERGARFKRGDSNRDGRLNLSDAISILDHLFRGVRMTCLDAGDFDDNGQNDITDAVAILHYLFLPGEKPSPPPPFQDPGLDPTEDDLDCEE